MAFSATRFRRWFVVAIVLVCLIVAGAYFHARRRVQNALQQVPQKLNIQIQQSAQAFTISKSEQGRTLFKLQANKAVQFKGTGHVELNDVMVTIYGKDSSRFDQIYGKQFEYDQQSGNVTSTGEVSIDLQSNPEGKVNSDQATPLELKNPIHLKTTNLVFNQKTGDAWTASAVAFYVPKVSGSAVGAKYDASQGVLTLQSQVRMAVSGVTPMTLNAEHAVLEKNPREIRLQHLETQSQRVQGRADEGILFLGESNTLDHAAAVGNINIRTVQAKTERKQPSSLEVTSQKLEVRFLPRNQIGNAIFSDDVRFKVEGAQRSEGSAGRVSLSFTKRNTLGKIRASEQVRLLQHQVSAEKPAQDLEVASPILDLSLRDGNRLTSAETIGPPQIRLLPANAGQGSETRITADKFTAHFDSLGQLSQIHGAANTRVVTTTPPKTNVAQPDRVSNSDTIDAYFRPGTGIDALVQQGHFTYSAGTQQAFAERARYTPADQSLVLTGAPRIVDTGMETTAHNLRLNRATGVGVAEGDVKTSYNDLKPQPSGGLLASSDPIHITAGSMTAQSGPGGATYKGDARLWQGPNMVQAPTIQFQRDQRVVLANSSSQAKVSTSLSATDNSGKMTPVHITSDHLSYSDAERRAHYEGSVTAQSQDVRINANQMDVFFSPGNSSSTGKTPAAPQNFAGSSTKLEKITASGSVLITQPNRRATGDKLTYTALDDKFVLTGGPPSIFDAEHGKITGVSLTLFRHDDRVVVDGSSTSPAVTQTRVVR